MKKSLTKSNKIMVVTEIIEMYSKDGEDSRITVELITEHREIDGNQSMTSLSFGEGEPEDMVLCRDLSDAYNIVEFAKLAYEAGKRGEDWEFTQQIIKD